MRRVGSRGRALAVFVGLLAACGGSNRQPVTSTGSISDKCPDLSKSDELAALDFAKEYNLSRDAADKLKAATRAAIEINTLADKLDAELGISCAQIAPRPLATD